MFRIADAHCDTLYSIGVHGADPAGCVITKERLEKGNVTLQTLALFAGGEGPAGQPYEKAQSMLAAREKVGIPIYTGALPDELPDVPSAVLSLEGGEILQGSLTRLDEFYRLYRIRLIALTWNNENEIGYPSRINGDGLKPFGKRLLHAMDERGIFADCSHLSEKGFWDICETAALAPVASHSNVRDLCDVHRNLRREQIRAIIEKKGFIGINFYSAFVVKEGKGTREDVRRHMDYIMEMGGEDILGFGSDFDGMESAPDGLERPDQLQDFCEYLLAHDYTKEQITKIAGGNYMRLLHDGERAAIV